ncbi:ErfK/YbiS/YcfS/YnhG [Nitrobacter sp. Nb-311A]|nr:ErfK/YbiS/YcfS/YnhG [Nitrobacter sp. Nb-311A]
MSLAGLTMQQAVARDPQARFFTEPTVVYADQSALQHSGQRLAYAERPNMGGGFVELLFGDVQQQGSHYPQQRYDSRPLYAPQPQQIMPEQDASEAAHPAFDPNSSGSSSNIAARNPPAPSSSIRRASSSTSCKAMAGRFATESASASPAFCGPASRR